MRFFMDSLHRGQESQMWSLVRPLPLWYLFLSCNPLSCHEGKNKNSHRRITNKKTEMIDLTVLSHESKKQNRAKDFCRYLSVVCSISNDCVASEWIESKVYVHRSKESKPAVWPTHAPEVYIYARFLLSSNWESIQKSHKAHRSETKRETKTRDGSERQNEIPNEGSNEGPNEGLDEGPNEGPNEDRQGLNERNERRKRETYIIYIVNRWQ